MVAKIRNLTFQPAVKKLGQSRLPNLLVAGCSYVWNNSEEHVCTWPYYLQDILGMDRVFDCSQSGGGPNLVFNNVVNEIITNPKINSSNTLIIIMWPELARTDVIVEKTQTISEFHYMSLQTFTEKFCNLSIYNDSTDDHPLSKFARDYKKLVGIDSQEYESLLKVTALASFLSERKFHWMFMPWQTMDRSRLDSIGIPERLISVLDLFDAILPLDDYTEQTKQRIPNDGHPTPDAHLHWTREHLLPHVATKWPSLIAKI